MIGLFARLVFIMVVVVTLLAFGARIIEDFNARVTPAVELQQAQQDSVARRLP